MGYNTCGAVCVGGRGGGGGLRGYKEMRGRGEEESVWRREKS